MILSLQNINLSFGKKKVLQNFSLSLNKNDKAVLLGESGSGKTSVLNLIQGFISPDTGTIHVFEKALLPTTINQIRSQIAYIPQEPQFFTDYTVALFIKQIFEYKTNKHLDVSPQKIGELLELFQLPQTITNSKFADLSGGEKQRIAIVLSILLERKLYLLDEITSALDNQNRQIVIDYFFNNQAFTFLSISHQSQWIERCNKIVRL